MDGSNYNPRRDDPPENEVKTEDDPRIVLLVVLLAVVIGTFLFTYRQQALSVADCLIGTGKSCNALLHPAAASERRPD